MDFVHKTDLLRGVTDLKKPVTCETVLNLQRGEKGNIGGTLVGEEKHLVNRATACKRAAVLFLP